MLLSSLALVTKCEENKNQILKDPNYIVLEVRAYPMPQFRQYAINQDHLYVLLSNKNTDKDSLLVEKAIPNLDYNKLAGVFDRLSEEVYTNKCVEDGMVMNLILFEETLETRNIQFSNIYNEELNEIIEFVNSNTEQKYNVYYDKSKLEEDLKNCN